MRFITFHQAWTILLIGIAAPNSGYTQKSPDHSDGMAEIVDCSHYSHVFAAQRNYRIFLPPGYIHNPDKRYPVIYFFHGWAQRYFGSVGTGYSNYDRGDENGGDNIERFVTENDVIVVKIDGVNRFSHEAFDLTPYNISSVTTFRQFPLYFKELVQYIDGRYRTLPDREHRAVSGLSMGGFMCFWVAAKYPDLVSAAGNFCGSTELTAGPLEFPVRYYHSEMYDNFKGVRIRMHNGTRDRLRFYHQDMNRMLLNAVPQYEFEVYEAGHITCGLGDMFTFLMNAFQSPLPIPRKWDHIDLYPLFEIWDYTVESDRHRPGFTILENVDKEGFKISVRNFLPDGELMPNVPVKVETSPVYKKNREYIITDFDLRSSIAKKRRIKSDASGRLIIETDGSLHQIGINESENNPVLCLADYTIDNMPWAVTGKEIELSIQVLNKGLGMAKGITGELIPLNDGLEVLSGSGKLNSLPALSVDRLKGTFSLRNKKQGVEIGKLRLLLKDESGREWEEEFEMRCKDPVDEITDFLIADGREMRVVKSAVDSITLTLGKGNGDGIANPGEFIVILARQNGNLYRTNSYSEDLRINANNTSIREFDSWQDYEHIGGGHQYTMPAISSEMDKEEDIWLYTEYWLPGSLDGQHIIKKGKVRIQVQGRDQTPPHVVWVQVLRHDLLEVRIHDGSDVEHVSARFIPNDEKANLDYIDWNKAEFFEIELADEGQDGDAVKGDRIFSRKIENQSSYFYNIEITATDSYGNREVVEWPEVFFLKGDKQD